jgi:hypothetical protein
MLLSEVPEIDTACRSSSRVSLIERAINVWSGPGVAVADQKQRRLMQTIRSWAAILGAYVILGRIIPSCSFRLQGYQCTQKVGAGEPESD